MSDPLPTRRRPRILSKIEALALYGIGAFEDDRPNRTPAAPSTKPEDANGLASGSVPLRNPKFELYARGRAFFHTMEEAAQHAGYPPRCGMCSKLERRADVRQRMAWLARNGGEELREAWIAAITRKPLTVHES